MSDRVMEGYRIDREKKKPKIQLVVTYHDHQIMYFPVETSWRIDSSHRCIVVGKFPRTYIPLDVVLYFSIEEIVT